MMTDQLLEKTIKNNAELDIRITKLKQQRLEIEERLEVVKRDIQDYKEISQLENSTMKELIIAAKKRRDEILDNIQSSKDNGIKAKVLNAKIKQNKEHISYYKTKIKEMEKNLKKLTKEYNKQNEKNEDLVIHQELIMDDVERVNNDTTDNMIQWAEINDDLKDKDDELKKEYSNLAAQFNHYETECLHRRNERLIYEKGLEDMITIINNEVRSIRIKKLSKNINTEVQSNAYEILSNISQKYDLGG